MKNFLAFLLLLLLGGAAGCKEEAAAPSAQPTPCPPGALGCPCRDGGACDTLGGQPLACEANVCVQPANNGAPNNGAPNNGDLDMGANNGQNNGDPDLPVDPDMPVDPDLVDPDVADPDMADPDMGGELRGVVRVLDGAARSCELVLRDPDGALDDLALGASLRGQRLREGDRLAVAFVTRADAPVADGELRLVPRGESALTNVQLLSGRCFDRDGAALDARALSLQP
jgi:hypothetical protein